MIVLFPETFRLSSVCIALSFHCSCVLAVLLVHVSYQVTGCDGCTLAALDLDRSFNMQWSLQYSGTLNWA
jgi:hypothetical protein